MPSTGKTVAELAESDLTKFNTVGLKKAEMFTYMAADGKTKLHGLIHFPSNFDPAKKYPSLLSVYGGPASASNTARETFVTPSALTEYGFLVLNLDSRAAPGMGKRTLDSIYLKLGQVEMDDMAAGVKALASRPVLRQEPRRHVRHVVRRLLVGDAAPALSRSLRRRGGVIAGRRRGDHYDSIYTERYMWIPQENKEGYDGRQRHDLRQEPRRAA